MELNELEARSGRACPVSTSRRGGLGGGCCSAWQRKGAVGGVGALVVSCKGTNYAEFHPTPLTSRDQLGEPHLASLSRTTDRTGQDNMSSLTGALESPDDKIDATSADVDMHPSSFEDAATPELEPKHEEEMGDLFGEDSNVDFVHHSRLVPPPS